MVLRTSKTIQIRDVPEDVYRSLAERANCEGLSLSDYLNRQLRRLVERPTMREWLERTRRAKPIPTNRAAAQVIREFREKPR